MHQPNTTVHVLVIKPVFEVHEVGYQICSQKCHGHKPGFASYEVIFKSMHCLLAIFILLNNTTRMDCA